MEIARLECLPAPVARSDAATRLRLMGRIAATVVWSGGDRKNPLMARRPPPVERAAGRRISREPRNEAATDGPKWVHKGSLGHRSRSNAAAQGLLAFHRSGSHQAQN
jgi:hypothetical protein